MHLDLREFTLSATGGLFSAIVRVYDDGDDYCEEIGGIFRLGK